MEDYLKTILNFFFYNRLTQLRNYIIKLLIFIFLYLNTELI